MSYFYIVSRQEETRFQLISNSQVRRDKMKNNNVTEKELFYILDLFEANFNKIEMIDISYKVKLNKEELNKLLDMTPLTWNLSDVEKEGIIKKNLSEITMSFKVLVGGFKTS